MKDYLGVVVSESYYSPAFMVGDDAPEGVVRARETALRILEERAKARGANALVGVTLDCEWTGGDFSRYWVIAMGTAVFIP